VQPPALRRPGGGSILRRLGERRVRQIIRALQASCAGARSSPRAAPALLVALLAACATAPPQPPPDPSATLVAFTARRLEAPGLPPPAAGWDRAQWLAAALELNPALAAQRAEVASVAAAERTAAEHRNPTMDLFAEYLSAAAGSGAWLYGLSLDFLLRQPGERARVRRQAALESALAQSDLAESIWQVRSALRQALLDAAAAQSETALLESLTRERRALVDSDRTRLALGDIARPQLIADQSELARLGPRRAQAEARRRDALDRLAAVVGVPASALAAVPVRWPGWDAVDALGTATPDRWRTEALIGRPQIVRALREYDLAEVGLEREVVRRWPQLEVTPAYAWGGDGVRAETLEDIARESAVGVSFELPLLNQHQGAIGEALARRAAAGERLKAAQAQIFGQIDRAESAWPAARRAWDEARALAALAQQQQRGAQRAQAEGAGDYPAALAAQIAATEAQLAVLDAAYAAEIAFGALEDAYHRPLEGPESTAPPSGFPQP
jgi:outer membrane protein, heavy metal efflux system